MVPTGGKGVALTRLASDVQNAVGLTAGGERRFPIYPHGSLANPGPEGTLAASDGGRPRSSRKVGASLGPLCSRHAHGYP